jgi:hypothetical protein
MFCIILGIIFLFISIIMALSSGINFLVAILFISSILAIFSAAKQRKQKKLAKQQLKQDLQDKNASWRGEYPHAIGLPIAENTMCKVFCTPEGIVIDGAGSSYTIPKAKIMHIDIIDSEQIQKSYVSSVGGTVAGAALFGPLGAMVGGRAKEKESTIVTNYLTITYQTDGETKYVSFNVSKDMTNAQKMVKLITAELTTAISNSVEL